MIGTGETTGKYPMLIVMPLPGCAWAKPGKGTASSVVAAMAAANSVRRLCFMVSSLAFCFEPAVLRIAPARSRCQGFIRTLIDATESAMPIASSQRSSG